MGSALAQAEEELDGDVSRPEERLDDCSPFVAANGCSLRVSCRLEPVLELKAFRRIGFRMARAVVDQHTGEVLPSADIQRLPRADLERIDLATMSRGIHRLEAEGTKELTLIAPVSCMSLSSLRCRTQFVDHLKEAQHLVERGLICEVTDIEGVPESALLASLTQLKPFCLFMIGRRSPPFGDTASLAAAGLQGASIECPPELEGDAGFVPWARSAIESGKRLAKSVMLFGVPTTRHMAIAAHLGATHASLRSATAARPAV